MEGEEVQDNKSSQVVEGDPLCHLLCKDVNDDHKGFLRSCVDTMTVME